MEENGSNENEKIVSKENTEESSKGKDKKNKKKDKDKSVGFFAKHKAEFKKIKWPTRQELVRETIVVIIVSLGVGAIIYGMDTVLQFGFGKLIEII